MLEKIQDMERNFYLSLPYSPANEILQSESGYAVDILDEAIHLLRTIF